MKPKILIISHGRWGKDTVAEMLANHGVKFQSSSMAAAEIFIYEELKAKYGYTSLEECYNDRNTSDAMRAEWYGLICRYNSQDKARLAKEIMKNNDCYVGMRDLAEIEACVEQGLFDLIIWVDASRRLVYREPETSFKIDSSHADIIIDNNGTLEDLKKRIDRIVKVILK